MFTDTRICSKKLILIEISEINLYQTEKRLSKVFPNQKKSLYLYLGSVSDKSLLKNIFENA